MISNKVYSLLCLAFLSFFTASGVFAQNLDEVNAATSRKLTKSDKEMLRDSLKAKARQAALEKEVDRQYRKREKEKAKFKPVSQSDVMYLFAVGINFNDSTVYLSDIIPVNYLRLEQKTGFLPYRTDFSLQFREYLEGKLGLVNETTSVFFHKKRKKIEKYYSKLKKRYLDEGVKDMIVVDPQKFSFKLPEYAIREIQQQQKQ